MTDMFDKDEFDEDCYAPSKLDYKKEGNRMAFKKTYGKPNTAELEKELIVVDLSGSGQWGPYIKANGEFYGMNEPLTDADFQKGEAYMVLFKRGKPSEKNPGGKKYIVQIVSDDASGSVASFAVPAVSQTNLLAKAATPKEAAKASYADADAKKGQRILWQGVVQAVARSPIFAGADEATFTDKVKATSEALVAFIEEKAGK